MQNSEIFWRTSSVERFFAAANQQLRLNADFAQFGDALLGRLGFDFAGDADVRHERHVDEQRVLRPGSQPNCADGFEERQTFDVARRAADFDDDTSASLAANLADAVLDFVGDVRNDLTVLPR